MKEIKFRVFADGKMNYLESKGTITYGYNGLIYWDELKHSANLQAIIMRFTGLKDRNGKEIYEDDILKRDGYTWGMKDGKGGLIPNVISSENILMKQNKMIVAKFEISEQCFSFSIPKESNYAERTHPATYEIIGNIHEHPNLMSGRHEA